MNHHQQLQHSFTDMGITAENHVIHKREVGVHIGNAVPVELGHAIGISIQQHLDKYVG